MSDFKLSVTFDKPVFSDPELTQEVTGPFKVVSTTRLPAGVYFSNDTYTVEGENSLGKILWSAVFTYPDNVQNSVISIDTGAVYDG